MTFPSRPATQTEILARYRCFGSVRFRHFVRETYNPRAANGVSHRQYSSAKLRVLDDGRIMVRHLGELVELAGTHITLPSGLTMVADLRVKSDYLPTNV